MSNTPQDKDATSGPAFINANRRGFLQGAAVAGGAAATGIATAVASNEVSPDSAAAEPLVEGKGYELTEHVKKYYQRARF